MCSTPGSRPGSGRSPRSAGQTTRRTCERYYPTTVMETGHDILFFWVARMIVMGLECTGQIPFRDVFLHGMVRVDGEKMSKVSGNVQDPLDIIGRYGTDALRLGLVMGTTPGKDVSISESKFDFQRDFVNKLWNIGRFVLGNVPPEARASLREGSASSLADRWIPEPRRRGRELT